MKLSDFDYQLPPELIAQTAVEPRDHSRLLVADRSDGSLEHRRFYEITDYLRAGDVLVFNDSRVIPARLFGRKAGTGGRIELLLLRRREPDTWEALVKPGRRINPGTRLEITPPDDPAAPGTTAEVIGEAEEGIRLIRFADESRLSALGRIPLPPYIHTTVSDPERYQTVYSQPEGSVAAPTAGLHFTPDLIKRIESLGCQNLFVTLHVGLDTFRPVKEDDPSAHRIHREYGVINKDTVEMISRAKTEGRRIIGVGTTSVRLLEAAAHRGNPVTPLNDWIDLYILPGHRFRLVDAMITNFHLPRSTLLMMVTAFAGKDLIDRAYREAIDRRYRFYSFGDAMLIL
jgi:S-adenosylmethionine:tRNA ribosyltransferase-isomerase